MSKITEESSNGQKEQNDCGQTRRMVLQSIGTTAGMLAGLGVSTREANANPVPDAPESFRVQGTEIVTTHIKPDEVRVRRRCVSTDLKERYGQQAIVSTETHPRPENQDDGLPKRNTRTIRRPWDTYYAKDDEWAEHLAKRDKEASSIETNALDKPIDCPKWYYENVDGGFERKGPMNLAGLTQSKNVSAITDILVSQGWSDVVLQHNRFAWVPQRSQFEMQHKSVATDPARVDGGKHAKFWATGNNYITGTAHEDNWVPHEAVSYNSAEFQIVNIFNSRGIANAIKNRYNFNNGGYLDHGGYVSHLYSSL